MLAPAFRFSESSVDRVLLEVQAAAQGVGEAAPLLEDFLLHEVAILALLRRRRVPVNGATGCLLTGAARQVEKSQHRHA
jgi:hypothetical protein